MPPEHNGTKTRVLHLDERAKDTDVWYSDGSLIVATPDRLFRAYEGILSGASSVFRKMLSRPGFRDTVMFSVPVLNLKDEDSTEMGFFLRALHDRTFYDYTKITDLQVVLAMLRLGTKYQVQQLREQAILQLRTAFPDTLEGFDNLKSASLIKDYTVDDITMLSVARDAKAPILLPSIYYWICTIALQDDTNPYMTFEQFWEGSSKIMGARTLWNDLSQEDLARMTFCGSKLRRRFWEYFSRILDDPASANCQEPKRCSAHKNAVREGAWWYHSTSRMDVLSIGVEEFMKQVPDLCDSCLGDLKFSLDLIRRCAWHILPCVLGLGQWTSLEKETYEQCVTASADGPHASDST